MDAPELDREEPGPRLGANWKRHVLSRVQRGREELTVAQSHVHDRPADAAIDAAHRHYSRAQAVALRPRRWTADLRAWLGGGLIDAAWSAIHAGDELLLTVQPDEAVRAQLPDIAAAVRTRLPATDERAVAYLRVLSDIEAGRAELDRDRRRTMRRTLNQVSDDAHARLRSFRNLALGVTVALTVVAVVLAFDAPGQEWLPVCAPAQNGQTPECATVPQIELVGALGGLLAIVAALVSFRGFSGPYALPAVMAILKVPAGALTGLLGAIWMQTEVFGFKAQEGGTILAYVALFGFAQQALTAFADRQAGRLLGNAQDNP